MIDISQKDPTNNFNNYKSKEWVKLIKIDYTISYDDYCNKQLFIPIAEVLLDNDIFISGKNKGKRKRDTLIKFISLIDKPIFDEKCEWLYIFTINNKIVKIGGTRSGIKDRCMSYLCGHHTIDRGKSGKCSVTNATIYNTFLFYLNESCDIKMFGYKLPIVDIEVKILNDITIIKTQTFHAYESKFIEDFKKNL